MSCRTNQTIDIVKIDNYDILIFFEEKKKQYLRALQVTLWGLCSWKSILM